MPREGAACLRAKGRGLSKDARGDLEEMGELDGMKEGPVRTYKV